MSAGAPSRRPSMLPPGRLEPRRLSGAGPAAVPQELSTPLWAMTAFFLAGVLFIGAFVYALGSGNRNVFGALLVIPPIAVITAFIARKLADVDGDNSIVALVMGAFALKMLGAALRYRVAYDSYGGAIDATIYHERGREYAAQMRQFDFDFEMTGRLVGTNFTKIITGFFYAFTPGTRLTGFIVFAWIAFLGAILYWRAFTTAVPGGNSRKYALLVFVMPSMIYWPSAIGKDAWMMLALGMCALGAARLLTRGLASAIVLLAGGLAGVFLVRPHLGVLVMNGLVLGSLFNAGKGRSPLRFVAIIGVVLVITVSVTTRTQQFFGVESINRETFEQVLDDAQVQTADGGSQYDPVRVRTPVDLPFAFGTVFYRPLIFEANNTQVLLTAFEGTLLALLTVLSWPSLRAIPRAVRRAPYTAYCLGGVLTFVIAFSAFSNFGLLARQRMQVVPLLFVLFCLAPRRPDPLDELHDDATPAVADPFRRA